MIHSFIVNGEPGKRIIGSYFFQPFYLDAVIVIFNSAAKNILCHLDQPIVQIPGVGQFISVAQMIRRINGTGASQEICPEHICNASLGQVIFVIVHTFGKLPVY